MANVRVTVGETDTNFDDPPEDEICDYLPADIFLVTCHTRMYGRYVRVTAVEVNHMNQTFISYKTLQILLASNTLKTYVTLCLILKLLNL